MRMPSPDNGFLARISGKYGLKIHCHTTGELALFLLIPLVMITFILLGLAGFIPQTRGFKRGCLCKKANKPHRFRYIYPKRWELQGLSSLKKQANSIALGCLPIFLIGLCHKAHSKIILAPGQTHKIPFSIQSDIHVSNGKVIHVNDTGEELIIAALKPGHSAISSGNHNWLIEVISTQNFRQRQVVHQTLKKIMGLKSNFNSHHPIIIKGFLYRLSDLQWIANQFKGIKYQLDIQVDPDIRGDLRDYLINMAIQKSFSTPQLQLQPTLSLHFFHATDKQKGEIKRHYDLYGISTTFSRQGLQIKPLIEVKILIAEVHRHLQKQWGVSWEGGYQARLLPHLISSGNLELTLQALESKGHGQILASPKLLCRSGAKAEFLAGGEFPIKVVNYKKRDIIWKRHGVHLSILPTTDTSQQLSIDLFTEISIVDNSQSVDGLPGLKTNRLQTHFDLKKSRTIALSGLLRHDFGLSSQGLPGLQSLPVIGKLFGSENYRKQLTELMIFVTPTVLEP